MRLRGLHLAAATASLLVAPTTALGAQTTWRPVGSRPLSDAAAKALVTHRPEIRPKNARANHDRPSRRSPAFHRAVYKGGPDAGRRVVALNPLLKRVTGRFRGTTDEIIQWGAIKWGIPEDVLRAVAVRESDWHQGRRGDRRDGVHARRYPARSRIDSDSVYESMGLMQIKWRPNGSLNPGTEPLRWKSTAFNVDYAAASVRYYSTAAARGAAPDTAPARRGSRSARTTPRVPGETPT